MTKPLFTLPIPSTGGTGTITATNPTPDTNTNIYLLTFTSPPDNRLTPSFITTFLLALDIIEHRFPKGVVVTTSGIPKFYSNGLDLALAQRTEGFVERFLWKLFRRLITYPMPTIALLNGHAFAGGLMLTLYHDYRIMNPHRGYLCLNELEFGVPLQGPMMVIFREKLAVATFRDVVLEARRIGGAEALERGVVDAVGNGVDDAVGFVKERGLEGKAGSGIYGVMKEEMYRGVLGVLDDHGGNLEWRERIEEGKGVLSREGITRVEEWEKESGSGSGSGKAKL
ncbi:ClpP/crotonase-like domain-containing protein [Aspergillus varians]